MLITPIETLVPGARACLLENLIAGEQVKDGLTLEQAADKLAEKAAEYLEMRAKMPEYYNPILERVVSYAVQMSQKKP